jgi:voltage-gated potassium channel
MRRSLKQRVILIAALVLFILLTGTIGFHSIEGYPLFDAFYMTLTTITSVGYQEIHPLSHAGRIFNSFLILFGVSAVFFAVGTMTQTIIELELQDRYGKRRTRYMINALKNHYIVCGFGRVGRNAAYELQRAKTPFVVVDRSDQRAERARSDGMLAMVADATRDECLREAGIARAQGLIAALPPKISSSSCPPRHLTQSSMSPLAHPKRKPRRSFDGLAPIPFLHRTPWLGSGWLRL